jgi:Calcineurin-like phosphoesterase
MNQLIGDRANVLTTLKNTIDAFRADGSVVQSVMNASLQPITEAQRQVIRQQIVDQLQDAYNKALATPDDGNFYMPQIPAVALFQTAMEEHMGPTIEVSQNRGVVTETGVPLPEKFGNTDPLWIECVLDGLQTLTRGKAPFVSHTHLSDFFYPIEDNCTIALLADWGADNPSAHNVAQQVKSRNPDYAIHMGDIYYAGEERECKNFLYTFRDLASKRSFAMNGNHEMYTGGRAYFGTVLPNLQQSASYFGIFNQNWQLLGLDTAYVEHVMTSPSDARLQNQFDWVVDKINNSTRKSVLLTHHQPFSAYQPEHDQGAGLREDVKRLTDAVGAKGIFAWFWGHEHKCTLYDDSFVDFKARLIGHGCIPHLPQTPPGIAPPVPYTQINTAVRPDGSGYAISGFALLTLAGPKMKVEYINEDGSLFATENWTAQAAKAAKAGGSSKKK